MGGEKLVGVRERISIHFGVPHCYACFCASLITCVRWCVGMIHCVSGHCVAMPYSFHVAARQIP